MKKIAVILILLISGAGSMYAQHYVGVKGGVGVSYGRFYPKRDQSSVFGLPSFAVAWKYYNSYKYESGVNKYFGGVSVEVEYMRRGYKYIDPPGRNPSITDSTYYRRDISTIAVPIMCQPHISLGRNDGVRLFLNAGFVVTYNISSKEYRYTLEKELISSNRYELELLRDKRLGYGLAGGPGINVIVGRWELTLEGRYYFDLADVLRTRNDFPDNPFIRSQVDKATVYFGVFYRFGNDPRYGVKPRVSGARIRRNAARAEEVFETEGQR